MVGHSNINTILHSCFAAMILSVCLVDFFFPDFHMKFFPSLFVCLFVCGFFAFFKIFFLGNCCLVLGSLCHIEFILTII